MATSENFFWPKWHSFAGYFCFWFFLESVSPKPLIIPLGPFRIFSKIRGEIRNSKFATGVVDTGGAPWLANISANFRKNSKRSKRNTLGLGGNWFMKKTRGKKSRDALLLRVPKSLDFQGPLPPSNCPCTGWCPIDYTQSRVGAF